MNGTNEGFYGIEIDGFQAVRAMKVSGGRLKHDPTLVSEGNRPNPHIKRGNYEIEEITVQQASALNETGREYFAWLFAFVKGLDTTPRGMRLVQFDEDGLTPVEVWDYTDCVPTGITPDDRTARGQNAASFTFTIKPTDMVQI